MIRGARIGDIPCMSHNRRIAIAGIALAASLGSCAAAGPSLAASSRTHVIKAQNIVFTPAHVAIHPGDRVTWKFLDAKLRSPHTVTSRGSQRFKDSPNPRLTGSFTVTFKKRGTYRFECTVHPASMSGVITVR